MSEAKPDWTFKVKRLVQYVLGAVLILSVVLADHTEHVALEKWGVLKESGRLVIGLVLINWPLVKEVASFVAGLVKRTKQEQQE